jgi:hypothetical protein
MYLVSLVLSMDGQTPNGSLRTHPLNKYGKAKAAAAVEAEVEEGIHEVVVEVVTITAIAFIRVSGVTHVQDMRDRIQMPLSSVVRLQWMTTTQTNCLRLRVGFQLKAKD